MPLARLDTTQALHIRGTGVTSDAARAASVSPLVSRLSLVTTVEGLAGLEAGWRKLEHTGTRPHGVFQSFDWLHSWANTYAAPGCNEELCIIAGFRGEQLAFVWPLMKNACGPVKVLRWAAEPLAQYGDILIAPTEFPMEWLQAATELIRRLRDIDSIRLRHVRNDAIATPFLRTAFRDARLIEHAPWLDLTAFANDAAYEARYNSSQRKRRKKLRKGLEDKFGPLKFEMVKAGACNDAAMGQAIAEKCKWLDERGRQNRILGSNRLMDFLKGLSRAKGPPFELVTSRMTAGSTDLSWEIGLRFGTSHFGFITSHVNALTDYSPARLHMDYSQRRALADGMTVFDLMVPHDAHKESWSSAAMETRDYHLALSPMGWAYGLIYLETLRPRLRAAYYRLPAKILRLLKPFTGH